MKPTKEIHYLTSVALHADRLFYLIDSDRSLQTLIEADTECRLAVLYRPPLYLQRNLLVVGKSWSSIFQGLHCFGLQTKAETFDVRLAVLQLINSDDLLIWSLMGCLYAHMVCSFGPLIWSTHLVFSFDLLTKSPVLFGLFTANREFRYDHAITIVWFMLISADCCVFWFLAAITVCVTGMQ